MRDRFIILLGLVLTCLAGSQSLASGMSSAQEVKSTVYQAQGPEPGPASEKISQFDSNQAIGAPAQVDLAGVIWQWMHTTENSGKILAPSDPADYTLEFIGDNRVNIQVDCNSGEGIYEVEEQTISIIITLTTLAACPPDSLEQPYLRDLQAAALYFFQDEDLYLDLTFDTGTMKFTRD